MAIKLQTQIPVSVSPLRISHHQHILLVGSCFTEHMGQKLQDFGFEVMMNPFGILYNPLSIAECLNRCYNDRELTEDELVFHDGLWHSWLHHGCFSNADKESCLCACNRAIHEAHSFLQQPHKVIITLGTANVYSRKGMVVANCHKIPNTAFEKRRLELEEIIEALKPYPALYTVSPIRHWADGAHGNQLSKATLLLAIEQMGGEYFPAYEIMMDELRDYRFYDQDMLHPSSLAIELIWERFQQTYMDTETVALGQKYHQLHLMEAHRPLYPDSETFRKHQDKIELLRKDILS